VDADTDMDGAFATIADATVTVTAGADISATEGNDTGDLIVATFTDANPGDQTGDFTATINWGDGGLDEDVTAGIVYTGDVGGVGTYAVHASHTYADEATGLTATVTVTDVGGS